MSAKKKKTSDKQVLVAKYVAISAWAVPAASVVDLIKTLIKHFL